jgi:hypothetical protein
MKQQYFSIKSLFISGLFVFASLSVLANNKHKASIPAFQIYPTVQYVGSENSGNLFSVQFDSDSLVKFDVIIKDGQGNVLYWKNFEASKFSKVFKLVNESTDTVEDLAFTIRVTDGAEYKFTATSTTNIERNVLISKF